MFSDNIRTLTFSTPEVRIHAKISTAATLSAILNVLMDIHKEVVSFESGETPSHSASLSVPDGL